MSLPFKKRKFNNGSLSSKVNKLQRQVAANKPEMRQTSYLLANNGLVPISILNDADLPEIIGQEFKLHRMVVAYTTTDPLDAWCKLYSPKEGYTSLNIPDPIAPDGDRNNYYVFDHSEQRVWKSLRSSDKTRTYGSQMVMDKKWSIPMTVSMENPNSVNDNVAHNQVYCVNNDLTETGTQNLHVTIFWTNA